MKMRYAKAPYCLQITPKSAVLPASFVFHCCHGHDFWNTTAGRGIVLGRKMREASRESSISDWGARENAASPIWLVGVYFHASSLRVGRPSSSKRFMAARRTGANQPGLALANSLSQRANCAPKCERAELTGQVPVYAAKRSPSSPTRVPTRLRRKSRSVLR